ncbi:MAG: hypothetical protein ABJP66_07380, partial [Hyphomicrobiales bacterium]
PQKPTFAASAKLEMHRRSGVRTKRQNDKMTKRDLAEMSPLGPELTFSTLQWFSFFRHSGNS